MGFFMNINKYAYIFAMLLTFGLVYGAQNGADKEPQFGELSLDAISIISDFNGKSDAELAQIRSISLRHRDYVSQYILQKSNASGVAIDFSKHGKWLLPNHLWSVESGIFYEENKDLLQENLNKPGQLGVIFLNVRCIAESKLHYV